jgi:hypothetical protein
MPVVTFQVDPGVEPVVFPFYFYFGPVFRE